jgi:hypothetical protein
MLSLMQLSPIDTTLADAERRRQVWGKNSIPSFPFQFHGPYFSRTWASILPKLM